MIAIFNTQAEAIAYSDKIHAYLQSVRPNYNAVKWADPTEGVDGKWSVKTPVEYDDNRWGTPLDVTTELASADGTTEPLPEVGEQCVIDQYYLYKGDILKCRQTHNRTIYDPKDTPALFSYFRDNSNQLEWIVGEQVEVGWMRIYNGIKYQVLQAHQTQADWTPAATLGTLWKVYVDPLVTTEWQVGVAYKVNQLVTYQNSTYKCLQAHTSQAGWTPSAVPALWQKQ
jgi:hypothetical protein